MDRHVESRHIIIIIILIILVAYMWLTPLPIRMVFHVKPKGGCDWNTSPPYKNRFFLALMFLRLDTVAPFPFAGCLLLFHDIKPVKQPEYPAWIKYWRDAEHDGRLACASIRLIQTYSETNPLSPTDVNFSSVSLLI